MVRQSSYLVWERTTRETVIETDELANVPFYEGFGFEVVGEEEVLGFTNRFMFRGAKGGHA